MPLFCLVFAAVPFRTSCFTTYNARFFGALLIMNSPIFFPGSRGHGSLPSPSVWRYLPMTIHLGSRPYSTAATLLPALTSFVRFAFALPSFVITQFTCFLTLSVNFPLCVE